MANCGVCEKISDYLIDSIMCSGKCHNLYHVKCIDAPFSSIKLFNKNKSFYYFCDKCDPFADLNITHSVLQNMKLLENMGKQLLYLKEKVENKTSIFQHNEDETIVKSKNKTPSKRKNDEIDDGNSEFNQVPKKAATHIFSDFTLSRPIKNFNFNKTTTNTHPLATTPAFIRAHSTVPPVSDDDISHQQPSILIGTTNISSISPLSTNLKSPLVSNDLNSLTKKVNDEISPISSGLKTVEGQKILFISKLASSTNALDIKNYLKQKLGTSFMLKVEKMLHRNYAKYSSFRIRVPDSIFHAINSTSFWPVGAIVHEFVNRPQNPFRQNRTMLNVRQSSF